jgi:hypothetical protein
VQKLYRRANGVIEYREAWECDGEVTFHWGIVGERGKSETYLIDGVELKAPAVANVLAPFVDQGFSEIPMEGHVEVVIQYRLPSWCGPKDLKKRDSVERIANEALGWTGNGHCDGGDFGSGSFNLFCLVVDVNAAVAALVKGLQKGHQLEGAVIAVAVADQYEVRWPDGFKGEFWIL